MLKLHNSFKTSISVAFPIIIPFALFPLGSLSIKDASLCKKNQKRFFSKGQFKGVKRSADFALTSAPFFFSIIDQLLKFLQAAKE